MKIPQDPNPFSVFRVFLEITESFVISGVTSPNIYMRKRNAQKERPSRRLVGIQDGYQI